MHWIFIIRILFVAIHSPLIAISIIQRGAVVMTWICPLNGNKMFCILMINNINWDNKSLTGFNYRRVSDISLRLNWNMKNYHPITDGMTIIHYNSIAHNISNPEKVPNTEMHFKYPVILRIYLPVSRHPRLLWPVCCDPLQSGDLQQDSDSLLLPRRTKNEYVWPDGMIPGSLYFNWLTSSLKQ